MTSSHITLGAVDVVWCRSAPRSNPKILALHTNRVRHSHRISHRAHIPHIADHARTSTPRTPHTSPCPCKSPITQHRHHRHRHHAPHTTHKAHKNKHRTHCLCAAHRAPQIPTHRGTCFVQEELCSRGYYPLPRICQGKHGKRIGAAGRHNQDGDCKRVLPAFGILWPMFNRPMRPRPGNMLGSGVRRQRPAIGEQLPTGTRRLSS